MLRAAKDASPPAGERGSALFLALIVAFVLSLLGLSFVLMAQTENQIAENETHSAQVLYAAEAGARAAKRWFDQEGAALGFPPAAAVTRTLRRVLDESSPDPTGATPADGTAVPYYKQGVDRDGDGDDDLFGAPYRGTLRDSLLGTEDGPDMRIDDQGPDGRAFLDQLSARLLGDLAVSRGGVFASISRVDVYAAPYLEVDGGWRRYGMGSLKVVARLYRETATGRRMLAERTVRAVLNETPYSGPYGPLHSGGDLTFTGTPLTLHWGAVTAVGRAKYTTGALPKSLPREVPATPWSDALWPNTRAAFTTFRNGIVGKAIKDPWLRLLSQGPLDGSTGPSAQPYPYAPPAPAIPDCSVSPGCDNSNVLRNLPIVTCPLYDYEVWKTIASSGYRDVHYYTYDVPTSQFRENGVGTLRDFASITAGAEGVYFFDTADGRAPHDDDSDGVPDNLTGPIELSGSWSARGFIYLNAQSFKTAGVGAAPTTTLNPPGEPFLDENYNGRYDNGELFVDLLYPATPNGNSTVQGAGSRAVRGGDIASQAVSFHGILYTNGSFVGTGLGTYYGSVIARLGVTQESEDGSLPTPEIYWDETIASGWPPAGWDLPRVIVTSWSAEP